MPHTSSLRVYAHAMLHDFESIEMYFASIETNSAAKKRHDDNLKVNAKDRLSFNAAKKKQAKAAPRRAIIEQSSNDADE